ncbi:Hypothetical_protein [Hexamita inflata]|uniref:Hypothetical_protein n=1 Tax=Hexamita inflata TaxID=28002 RepID=A0AA86N4M6_9EUKA|nr:Hypothetical protein HINF_LOCUS472 [Hexamita inflata]
MSTIKQQKSLADQMIYEFKAQKDVLMFTFAFVPIVICYSFAYLQTRTITFSSIKILTRIVIIVQILMFLIQVMVWKSCTETIIVRTFGQVGFLTSYLWSRLLQASTDAYLDSSLKITLLIPERIFMTIYLIRILKYIMMLNQIVQVNRLQNSSQYFQAKSK